MVWKFGCCFWRYRAVETLHETSDHRECFLYLVQRTVSFVEIKNTINSRCRAPIQTFDCGGNSFTHNAVWNRNLLMWCTPQKSPMGETTFGVSQLGGLRGLYNKGLLSRASLHSDCFFLKVDLRGTVLKSINQWVDVLFPQTTPVFDKLRHLSVLLSPFGGVGRGPFISCEYKTYILLPVTLVSKVRRLRVHLRVEVM